MRFRLRERVDGGKGYGPIGKCVCQECGKEYEKIAGVECTKMKCVNCDVPLVRKSGECDKNEI